MISPALLEILACPETKQPLRLATDEEFNRIREELKHTRLFKVGGEAVEAPLDGVLVREDGLVAYAIREGIPILLVEEGFRLPRA
jgi:uncharacterized protein